MYVMYARFKQIMYQKNRSLRASLTRLHAIGYDSLPEGRLYRFFQFMLSTLDTLLNRLAIKVLTHCDYAKYDLCNNVFNNVR